MKFAMYGSGAAGSVFASYLRKGGADIILIDRYEAHMKKVAEEGMHFTIHQEEDGGYKDYDYQLKGFRTYITAADAAAAEGKVDVIIYMTKATQLEQAIQDSLPVVGDSTVAVSLINGLGNDDNLFKVFPKERCIIGSGVLGTALPEPAHCVSTPAGGVQMNFGGAVRSELTDAACAEMLKCYRAGGCDAYWRDGEPGTDNNIYKFIWKKVCVNATVNTVCAVLRLKIGEVEADPFGQWLFHSVIRETCAVATAKGVPMDADEFIAHDHKDIVTNIADYYPSMCQDMLFNHRQTEIDVLNGKIAEYGEQLGIVSGEEALHIAEEQGLDLVKISPQATPPVCKLMNYGKYKFEQSKREKEARKNQHVVEIKEIRMSPGIDVGDFNTKLKNAQKFLSDGNRVKVSVRFRGREMAHTEIGRDLLSKFADLCTEVSTLDKAAKLEGRNMSIFLSPKAGK